MSERRVGNVIVQVEYQGGTSERRVGNVLAMVEYQGGTIERRVGNVLVMVEYKKPWPGEIQPYGPAVQII
jgi:hypothetical protein